MTAPYRTDLRSPIVAAMFAAVFSVCCAATTMPAIAFVGEAPSSSASPSDAKPAPSIPEIVAQQTALRAQVQGRRGAFKNMHEGDRLRLLARQDRLLELLRGKESLDGLRAEERVEVFNALQEVEAAATKAEEERTICERTRLTGSHRFSVVCMSGREYREHKENARKGLRTVMKCEEGCVSD
jgi:hypothetical protein